MTDHRHNASISQSHTQEPKPNEPEVRYDAAQTHSSDSSASLPLPTSQLQQHLSNDSSEANNAATYANQPQASYPRWHDAVAGALAGAGSRLVTAPLDLIRIRRQLTRETLPFSAGYYPQLLKQIVQTEQGGVFALFRGNLAAMYMWVAYAAVQFSVYTEASDYLKRSPWNTSSSSSSTTNYSLPSPVIAFVSGGAAGVCATLSTYPLDICRTTFAARGHVRTTPTVAASGTACSTVPPTTIWGFATQLYQTKGWKGFYAGSGPAVIQIIPYMGFNFLIYEAVVHHLQEERIRRNQQQHDDDDDGCRRPQHPPQLIHSGLAGAVAGAISKFAVYPLDTIKKRLQIQSFYTHPPWDDSWITTTSSSSSSTTTTKGQPHVSYNHHYTGMWDCAWKMYHTEGFSSFYRGVLPSLVKSALAASLTFAIFSSTKRFLQTLNDDNADADQQTSQRQQ